jgi:hypothetical protein
LPEDLPVEALPQLIETPDPVAPIAEVEQPISVPLSDARPRPRPLDRVAATPVDSPTDAPEIADQVIVEVTDQPTEEAVIVEEEQQAAAQNDLLVVTDETRANGLFTISEALQQQNIDTLAKAGYNITAAELFDMSLLAEVYAEHPELLD